MILNKDNKLVLAVIVLYEREVEEAESFNTLISLLKDSLNNRLILEHILIYDNSEKAHKLNLTDCNSGITYFHNQFNGGTVAAYSYAFELADRIGANWLLVLDHDTAIPSNHLVLAADELNANQDANTAALVPFVKHGKTIISPALLNKYGSIVPSVCIKNKKESDIVTAISSGIILNTELVKQIMPFPKELWLDYVDHWIFLQLSRSKWSVLSFNSVINHHLSIEDPLELGISRMLSILNGEAVFFSQLGSFAKKTHYLRIANRIIKYLRHNPRLVPPMLRWFLYRIIGQKK
jgi:hypothetical protein